ncbi:hypothetical protein NQ318_020169 [Aromia moschata]|uniref:FAM13A-like domain-containing protein n=1 Tax=Aromia moschata TaxID=1265417 RepID=A0AAV8ZC21_9CUCU|nr:hypothetical protein NQ318_020169 [Aromia moschata]
MKGPTRKEEVAPKAATRLDYDTKVGKVKRMMIAASLANKPQTIPTTYDEAKASCKARKRKERQESISSLCQERKVIRSNSEERPAQKKYMENKNMRRVSSSEDFQKSASTEKLSVSPSRMGKNEKTLAYDDCEHERRRSHERFARPLTLKSKKHPNKRLKVRYASRTRYKPELPIDGKDKKTSLSQDHEAAPEESENGTPPRGRPREVPSPTATPVSPVLDFSTLHEQIDCSEPVLSHTTRQISENTETMPSLSVASNRLLSSPRNSIIATHRIYLDPDVPQMTVSLDKKPQNPVDERLQKLTKQINSMKRKVKKFEADFEVKYGFKPSHVEKMNDKAMKKVYADLGRLKKEQKQLNEVSASCSLINGAECKSSGGASPLDLQSTVDEIEKVSGQEGDGEQGLLAGGDEARTAHRREDRHPEGPALLESIHGRPNNKEDRDLVRPYYDRYRTLKRMVAKVEASNASGNELATIHENETMNFITPTSSSQSNDTESEKTAILPSISTDSDTDTSIGENLHALSRSELVQQLKAVTEEKKELRRKIKEFEMEVQLRAGRMIHRDDKAPMEGVYVAYKKTKAKVRLLEALGREANLRRKSSLGVEIFCAIQYALVDK